jgi:fatty acid desaturase
LAIWESFQRLKESPKNKILRRVLFWFVVGYLSFILPLTLVYIFIAGSRGAIASIMCGFAIIFAIILAFKILPLYHLLDDHDTVEKKPAK